MQDNDPENEANPYAHALLDSDESLLNKLSHAKYYLNGTERRSKSLGGSTKNITRIVPVVQVRLVLHKTSYRFRLLFRLHKW